MGYTAVKVPPVLQNKGKLERAKSSRTTIVPGGVYGGKVACLKVKQVALRPTDYESGILIPVKKSK